MYGIFFWRKPHNTRKKSGIVRQIKFLLAFALISSFVYIWYSDRLNDHRKYLFGFKLSNNGNSLKEENNKARLASIASFFENWRDVSEHGLNVSRVQSGCDTTWCKQDAVPWFKKAARTDVEASYIKIWEIRPAEEFSRVVLQTQFVNKTEKNFGGDYWRCNVRGTSAIPVTKTDLGNGAYEFTFLPIYPGPYYMKLWLEYTLCDGIKDAPDDWFVIGNIQGKGQRHGSLLGDTPYISKALWDGTDIQFNVPPNPNFKERRELMEGACLDNQQKCRFLWNGLGSWVNRTTWDPLCKSSELSYPRNKEGILWIFGDSVSSQFYHAIKRNRLCKQVFKNCLYTYNWVYSLENYNISLARYTRKNVTVEKSVYAANDFSVSRVLQELTQALFHPSMDRKSAVLLNYGLHFTQSINFTSYKRLIREVIELSKTAECKIVWRTTTSLNRHKYAVQNLHSRRFMTSQRVEQFNAFATREFCNAGIDVLDVYPLTDSYPEGTGSNATPHDPVHYPYHVMRPVEKLLERVFQS